MSKRAHADIVVPRTSLSNPQERQQIRMTLYRTLMKLGHVDAVERYVADPPDGPYRDSHAGDIDFDKNVVVRIVGQVTPFS